MVTNDIKSRFGTAIRTERKRLGISQEELAGRAGLHRTYVADIERGARNLSLANIERLAKALGTSIPALFTDSTARGTATHPGDVLLVEDEAADVELVLRAFKKACLTNPIHVAHDGAEALDYIFCTGRHAHRRMEDAPQVILLDLSLPKVNGVEVLRRVKSDPRSRSIPVVVISAFESGRDVEEAKRAGADTLILKPVDFQRFSQITPQLHLCWALLKGNDVKTGAV
jgi:CheY-like chemotaxis protein